MKKFVFPLESVLVAKRLLEQEAKKNLAHAEERLAQEQPAARFVEQGEGSRPSTAGTSWCK